MCQLKSCLVLKDRVFCPDYDSHEDMLCELKISDTLTAAAHTFVRAELLPPDDVNGLMQPLNQWELKVDQAITPAWWDATADRARVEEAVEAWRAEHVFAAGEHTVRDGKYYAFGNATVRAYDSATVWAYDNVTVKAYHSAAVKAYLSATVWAYNRVTVRADDSATVTAYDSATVWACNSATVDAYGHATVIWPVHKKVMIPKGWAVEAHEIDPPEDTQG